MYLPATFQFQGTNADSKTFKHTHRNDYIAVPVASSYSRMIAYNWHQFDMLNRGLDHIPTCLDVEYFITKSCPNDASWRDLNIDRQLLSNYNAVMAFKRLLLQIPLPEADALVDQHAEYNTRHIQHAMKTAFALVPGRKIKSHLSNNTWQLVQLRRVFKGVHRDTINATHKRFQITILRAWHLLAYAPLNEKMRAPSFLTTTCNMGGGLLDPPKGSSDVNSDDGTPIIEDADGYLRPLRHQASMIQLFLDLSQPTAIACLKEDRDDFVASISRQINSAPHQDKHNLAWKLIKPLQVTKKTNLRFGCQKLASPPKDGNGVPITDPTILSGAKLDFFSHNEAATQCSREELLKMYSTTCNRRQDILDGRGGVWHCYL